MSYGNVRTPGVIETYYVDPECPDDMYMTPDPKFWAKCAGQQAKANFISTIIAVTILLIIILTILYFVDASGLCSGIAIFIGLVIIGLSAFNMLTAERVAETMHREATMKLASEWGVDYKDAFETKGDRQVLRQEYFTKLKQIRDENRQQTNLEKTLDAQTRMHQGVPITVSQPSTPGSEIGKGVGSAIGSLIQGIFTRPTTPK